jgi:hypothetical protein
MPSRSQVSTAPFLHAGHIDIASFLRQQSAISCCTMSLKIELQNIAIHPIGSDFVAWLIEMPHRRLASSEASPQSPSNRQAR